MAGSQFPYPRKTSTPAPYTSTRAQAYKRQRLIKTYGPAGAGIVLLLWLLIFLVRGASSGKRVPVGTPKVVIVTTISPNLHQRYVDNIIENREDYAMRHGYATFYPNTTDYDLMSSPESWSTIPAIRHAMTLYPDTEWFWFLGSTALIMNTQIQVHDRILEPRKLEKLMQVDVPIVPPDSIIKTFAHLRPERVDFVLSQDSEGLADGSMFVRNGEWARSFLDAWYDPLYRQYNFQQAERHALEHMVQWHSTILSKLALVPQREINSYTRELGGARGAGVYQEGDFVANFHDCRRDPARSCEEEMVPLLSRWRELRDHGRKSRR